MLIDRILSEMNFLLKLIFENFPIKLQNRDQKYKQF